MSSYCPGGVVVPRGRRSGDHRVVLGSNHRVVWSDNEI